MNEGLAQPDPWQALRRATPARIALGRAGGSLPTRSWLEFQSDHAAARDAVVASLDTASLIRAFQAQDWPVISGRTQARTRHEYLARPDLGRRLNEATRKACLTQRNAWDVAVILADGLSAPAAQRHGAAVALPLRDYLSQAGRSVAPLVILEQARVAVQDDVGESLSAMVAVILLGERPGLSAAASLGAYLVHSPRMGRTDAERNCVSNIHDQGLAPALAAERVAALVLAALAQGASGLRLEYRL